MWGRERGFRNCCELSKIEEELFFSAFKDKEKKCIPNIGKRLYVNELDDKVNCISIMFD